MSTTSIVNSQFSVIGTAQQTLEERLAIAIQSGNFKEVQQLLSEGANPNGQDQWGNTMLDVACGKGTLEIVQELLQKGADRNTPSGKLGYTPLHRACMRGDVEIAKILINNGARINEFTKSELRPLDLAVQYGHIDCARMLLNVCAVGAVVDGSELLQVACEYAKTNVDIAIRLVRLLLYYGARPNVQLPNTYTPFTYALAFFPQIAQEFICMGDAMEETSCDKRFPGWRLLHFAVFHGFEEMTKILLSAGATRKAHNDAGQTPLALVKKSLEDMEKKKSHDGFELNMMQRWKNSIKLLESK